MHLLLCVHACVLGGAHLLILLNSIPPRPVGRPEPCEPPLQEPNNQHVLQTGKGHMNWSVRSACLLSSLQGSILDTLCAHSQCMLALLHECVHAVAHP